LSSKLDFEAVQERNKDKNVINTKDRRNEIMDLLIVGAFVLSLRIKLYKCLTIRSFLFHLKLIKWGLSGLREEKTKMALSKKDF
jgi:hypothetical protein